VRRVLKCDTFGDLGPLQKHSGMLHSTLSAKRPSCPATAPALTVRSHRSAPRVSGTTWTATVRPSLALATAQTRRARAA
jgi:hypothetical protein